MQEKNPIINNTKHPEAKKVIVGTKDFERKGNRWLEFSRQFILDSNQALIIVSEENLEVKRDFLKKIGSNPHLASRSLLLDFKNPWLILSETPVASLCDAPNFGENGDSIFWLRDLDSMLLWNIIEPR